MTGLALNLAIITVGNTLNIKIEERDQYGNLRDTITWDEFTDSPTYFDLTFIPVDPSLAYRTYSVVKPLEGLGAPPPLSMPGAVPNRYFLQAGDPFHQVAVAAGGNGTANDRPYLAGLFLLHITDQGVHIKGSPVEVNFQPGSFYMDQTVVYGPGVNFNNSNPGTVRSGVPTE
eukprot:scaffold319690_cov45-Prasinocladus_malaysianus.AAC.1